MWHSYRSHLETQVVRPHKAGQGVHRDSGRAAGLSRIAACRNESARRLKLLEAFG